MYFKNDTNHLQNYDKSDIILVIQIRGSEVRGTWSTHLQFNLEIEIFSRKRALVKA